MKKIICSIILIFAFSSSALAFAPVIIPLAGLISLAAHFTGMQGMYYFYKISSAGTSTVQPSGDVTKPSQVQWVDLTLPTPAVVSKPLTATMPLPKLMEISEKKTDGAKTYPLLNDALHITNAASEANSAPMPLNTVFQAQNGGLYVATSATGSSTGGGYDNRATFNAGVGQDTMNTGTPTPYGSVVVTNTGTAPYYHHYALPDAGYPGHYLVYRQDVRLPTGAELANMGQNRIEPEEAVVSLSTLGSLKSQYQAELDKAFQDPDYVPTFTDDTTGLPFSPPPPSQVATPAQVDAYNKTGAAADSAAASVSTAAATAASAAAAATTAAATAAAANAAAANAPGDSALAAAAAAANAAAIAAGNAAGTAATTAAAVQAAADTAAAEKANEELDTAASIPEGEERKTLDFTPLDALKDALATTYPFNVPTVIGSYFSAFAGTPAAPVFDLPLPLGNSMHVDLSCFDPIAALFRFLIGLLVTVGIMFYVVHFYRGIS